MKKYGVLLAVLMLAGCSAQPTVKSWMDPVSSVTITAQTEPMVMIRAEPPPVFNERDYAQLTAIEVNRMGDRRLYLVAILWTTADFSPTVPQKLEASFQNVEVQVGDRALSLARHAGTASELGISQSALPLPIPGSTHIYFPIEREDLLAISRSNRILLTARGVPDAPRRYEEFSDGRQSLSDFLSQLPGESSRSGG